MSDNKPVAADDYNMRKYNDGEVVYRSMSDGSLVVGGQCPPGFMENGTVADWKAYFRDYDMRQIQMAQEAGEI